MAVEVLDGPQDSLAVVQSWWRRIVARVGTPFRGELRAVSILAFLATLTYSTLSMLRYSTFRSSGYDLGIFDQVVRQYSAFMGPYSEIKGLTYNILGDHFHPIIAILGPLYWLWNDPRMLGIALAVLVASSIYPVYLFCRARLGPWASLAVSAGYVFWWPIQSLVNFDFHEIAFGVPLMAWIILALDRNRYIAVGVLSVILLGVREDMGFMVMAIALIIALRRRWKLALALLATGAAGYLFTTGRFIPHFNKSGSFGYWEYTTLGPTMGSAIAFMAAHPLKTAAILFDNGTKQFLWAALFFPLWLLPLASPYVLLAAPILASRLLSDRPGTWSTAFQYNAILAPILVLAAVDVLSKLVKRFPRIQAAKVWAPAAFTMSVAVGIAFIPGLFPIHNLVTGKTWEHTAHMAAQQRVVNMIPSGVCVEADDRLVPHLTNRTNVGLLGRQVDYANWAVIDFAQTDTGGGGDGNFTPFDALRFKENYGFRIVHQDDGIVLLYRPYLPDRDAPELCSSPYQSGRNE
ncbi:DUF2079 domain-containing protein [Arthrobacter psychrochitiniphilus]|uniref:DUF2079 domain-containing protein n=1 Tax=Arthrobacter psychrochitiniphilus TaxID=291045 RepID=A0A2V3DMA9_9MICC|nr:DUF2079 domain-containing protein [Arthrobacter psychrochitiniphilus]NYG17427.1 putative membrane protein [Arthrobacter psychrochitiniphilus]PXA64065.1 hypothetical protein CVS29_16990 [Arthrobacter psychrochitiniphilus]